MGRSDRGYAQTWSTVAHRRSRGHEPVPLAQAGVGKILEFVDGQRLTQEADDGLETIGASEP
jgi:hypothetical protein